MLRSGVSSHTFVVEAPSAGHFLSGRLDCKPSCEFPILLGWAATLLKLWEPTSRHGHLRSQGIIMVPYIYMCG